MVILILLCLSFGWNLGMDLWGVLAMSQDQIIQVMLVAVVTKYTGASMSSIWSLASMLSQLSAFVRTKRKQNQLHRELSAATLISVFLGVFIERVYIEGSQPFPVQQFYKKTRCLVCNSIVHMKRWLSEMVNVKFFVDLCRLRVKTLCSEDVCWGGQGAWGVDIEQTHGEEIHRVKLTSCFDDLCALVWDLAFVELYSIFLPRSVIFPQLFIFDWST